MNPSWISAIASCVTAIGSLAAFGTAVWAARAAWKQLKYSADQQRHRDERDEQEQASKFAAWVSIQGRENGKMQGTLRYINTSKLPIHDFTAIPVPFPNARLNIDMIEPTDGVCSQMAELGPVEDVDGSWHGRIDILVRFRDNQNILWRREPNGVLRKAKVDELGNDLESRILDEEYQRILYEKGMPGGRVGYHFLI
ncbi:hypothetical protein QFW96_14600 [Saccharopolyspora sp. TS4A08]|uniref:Uncharacterized protein n=1 Tax=Saccharopolyspora ipomoeae TaxID=3042027 RepID=A0ABT6PQC6_9PSEU|nr:hypothetical protein [Saccharopolyspora sp. TS4A08]MDI2029858.1 hypothetical protein [Saccharopolyspora sp. TS4A08]